jgi:hypothetical protein
MLKNPPLPYDQLDDDAEDLEAASAHIRRRSFSKLAFSKCWAKKSLNKAKSASRVPPEEKASEQKKAKSVGELDNPANWAKGAVILAANG